MASLYDSTTKALNPDYRRIGRVLTNFMLSIVHYKAPNVNTGRGTK